MNTKERIAEIVGNFNAGNPEIGDMTLGSQIGDEGVNKLTDQILALFSAKPGLREVLENLIKLRWVGEQEKAIDQALAQISNLYEPCHPKSFCDICFTSSWAPVPKGTPNAQKVKDKDEWVICQMCEAERKLKALYEPMGEEEIFKILCQVTEEEKIEYPIQVDTEEWMRKLAKSLSTTLKPSWTEELSKELERAIKQLKAISCPQNCSNGGMQVGEEEYEQCQWCDEIEQHERVLSNCKQALLGQGGEK